MKEREEGHGKEKQIKTGQGISTTKAVKKESTGASEGSTRTQGKDSKGRPHEADPSTVDGALRAIVLPCIERIKIPTLHAFR